MGPDKGFLEKKPPFCLFDVCFSALSCALSFFINPLEPKKFLP